MVQVSRLARCAFVVLHLCLVDSTRGKPLHLIRAFLCGISLCLFVPLAEVALALPDDWRRGGVARLFPLDMAVALAHAMKRAVESCEVDMLFGENRRGDDLSLDWLFPVLGPVPEVKAGEVVPTVSSGIRVSHVDPPRAHGGHAHQRVAQPLFPDRLSLDRQDFQLAALGVEDDEAFIDHGRGGPIVAGLILPENVARAGVERIELVAAEPSAHEHATINHGRRGERTLAGELHLPAAKPAIRTLKRARWFDVGKLAFAIGLICKGLAAFLDVPALEHAWSLEVLLKDSPSEYVDAAISLQGSITLGHHHRTIVFPGSSA